MIKPLPLEELKNLFVINRQQHVQTIYQYQLGQWFEKEVNWHIPSWSDQNQGMDKPKFLSYWQSLADDAKLWGYFVDEPWVGCALYRRLDTEQAQLALLHVDHQFRGQGIGGCLWQQVYRIAKQEGKEAICRFITR